MAKKKKDDESEMSDGSIPVNDAWTGMLAISLIALVVATGFLSYDYFFVMAGPEPKVYQTLKPGAAPKVVIPKAEEAKDKDKDKEPAKDIKEPEKDKDMEKDKDKEKDKGAIIVPLPELATQVQVEVCRGWLQRREDVIIADNRRVVS